ncbi:collagen-like protein [Aequorivita echinoideorum]|uniref:Collagen-like protein n=1 Tax=Aequorivita echinoideorum TaxID=1549647 RepID=A0ABS5S6E3_9FLAO|nr:collagen-like protein [Aequorivita echinoideorum]MBT0608771.1 collagen-like protein [Aequorivita echinoideorum]
MKHLLLFLALSSTIFFTSCEGDPGPPGEPGGLIFAQVFEVNANFNYEDYPSNTYFSPIYTFPFEVFESDVVLTYRLSGQDNTINPPADIWTQLPQSVFYQDGTGDIFQYNFNNTFRDLQFTIEGNFDLTNIDPSDLNNQIFRIAVVPAEFAATNPTIEQILERGQIDTSEIERIQK